MFKDPDEMLRFINDEKVEFLDLKVIDMPGRWRHITFATQSINESLFDKGYGLSLSPYPGFRVINNSDMIAKPDPTTAFVDPFRKDKTLTAISDTFYTDGTPYERNPRTILRRAEAYMKSLVHEDAQTLWLPEMEFYIFDRAAYGSSVNRAYYELSSLTGSWNHPAAADAPLVMKMPDTGVGQIDTPRDRHSDLRSEMVRRIEDAGYSVKYHHHELGGAGQCEIEPYFDTAMRAADSVMVMKYMIHNTAMRRGFMVTFMPKPLVNSPGTGLHYHQYIEKDGLSLFYDKSGKYASLSEAALHYVGGLCAHTGAIMAFACPTSNSYRRFGVGLAAPMNLFFSAANRSAAVRIPGYSINETEQRVEYRLPDALANPYLVMAAQLMAGLDGIKNKIDPTAQGFGPYDFNNYELPPEERAKIKSAPTSLEKSLDALAGDGAFLTAAGVFPDDVSAAWINLKLTELDDLARRPHPYEFELYFDF